MNTPLVSDLAPDTSLFDPVAFANLVTSEPSPVSAVKKAIKAADEVLNQRFVDQGNIKNIIRSRAWIMDQLLSWLWQQLKCSFSPDISLMAVGGYGRGELHPQSDIDLLILLRDDAIADISNDIETFITQLWDIGLEVGQSVRSVSECQTLARDDITIATNLMESRTIAGNPELGQMMQVATDPDHIWPVDTFFSAKKAEQIERHRKFGFTEQSLEPDVKNGPGGLRDIQTIGWVAKRYFKAERLSGLITHDFLTKDEYLTLDAGHQFLWEVRYALHIITNRSENKLLFDHQRAVADMLGYRDSNANLAVEKFMKRYYRVVQSVSQLNELLLRHFDEAILSEPGAELITPFNSRFQFRNKNIEAIDSNVFENTPSALLEIFVILAQHEELQSISASTIRLIRDNAHLIDNDFRNDTRNTALFIELIRSPYRLFTQLSRMKRYGVLGKYIPSFGRVTGQMQYDLFHIYTVDAHTLTVVKNMRLFRNNKYKEKFPVATHIVHRLPKIELLYLAGIFHDLGKGKNGDHSSIGAVEALKFCYHHRLSNWDAQVVAWLVQNHLLMSITAQKKDVSDPDIIHEFANIVGDQLHLDYLYALTVADICATNPTLWNGWRSSLLRQLYTETRRALRRGLERPVNKQEWIEETKDRAKSILCSKDFNVPDIEALWDQLGDDYFLREPYGDVVRHTQAILSHDAKTGPLVVIGRTEDKRFEGAAQVFIYTEDAPNLFAVSVAALNQLNLSIADARIMTSSTNFSLDTYVIMEENGQPLRDDDRLEQIKQKMVDAITDFDNYSTVIYQRTPRTLKHFNIPTEIVISNDLNRQHTAVEIISLDWPGLLAEIGCFFTELGVHLKSARIATLGERVEDVFYITNASGGVITDPEILESIEKDLKQQLDENNPQPSTPSA